MSRKVGNYGEKLAQWYIAERKGYRITARNIYSRFGEIDLIAQDGDQVVFVEVKYRIIKGYAQNCGLPEDYVDRYKLKKLKRTILYYISKKNIQNFRIDVCSITHNKEMGKIFFRYHMALSDQRNHMM